MSTSFFSPILSSVVRIASGSGLYKKVGSRDLICFVWDKAFYCSFSYVCTNFFTWSLSNLCAHTQTHPMKLKEIFKKELQSIWLKPPALLSYFMALAHRFAMSFEFFREKLNNNVWRHLAKISRVLLSENFWQKPWENEAEL